jgi:hypothetical protein
LRESLTRPTQIIERVSPPVYKPEVIERPSPEMQAKYREITERYKPTVEYEATKRELVERPPVIHEIVKKVVIEEVQPVIYREVTEPHVIVETRPIYERVREAPKVIHEMRPAEYLHHRPAVQERLVSEPYSGYEKPLLERERPVSYEQRLPYERLLSSFEQQPVSSPAYYYERPYTATATTAPLSSVSMEAPRERPIYTERTMLDRPVYTEQRPYSGEYRTPSERLPYTAEHPLYEQQQPTAFYDRPFRERERLPFERREPWRGGELMKERESSSLPVSTATTTTRSGLEKEGQISGGGGGGLERKPPVAVISQ